MNGVKIARAGSKEQAVEFAVDILRAELELTLEKRGTARLMLSGGGSPKPVYEALSSADLDWAQVVCGLVDERRVPEGHGASNASFIRAALLQNKAALSPLVPMTNDDVNSDDPQRVARGAQAISADYLSMGVPYDICVMGMGSDGHTASWFPGSPDLEDALDMNTQKLCMEIDARGCDGAGEIKERITLTRPAILSASTIILFIPGEAKREVFYRAMQNYEAGNMTDLPVAALFDAGEKLTVILTD